MLIPAGVLTGASASADADAGAFAGSGASADAAAGSSSSADAAAEALAKAASEASAGGYSQLLKHRLQPAGDDDDNSVANALAFAGVSGGDD